MQRADPRERNRVLDELLHERIIHAVVFAEQSDRFGDEAAQLVDRMESGVAIVLEARDRDAESAPVPVDVGFAVHLERDVASLERGLEHARAPALTEQGADLDRRGEAWRAI